MQEKIITKTIGPIFQLDESFKTEQSDLVGKWILIQVSRGSESQKETCQIAEIDPNKKHALVYKTVDSEIKFYAVSGFSIVSDIIVPKVHRYLLGDGKISRNTRTVTATSVRLIPEYIRWDKGSPWNLGSSNQADEKPDYPRLTEVQAKQLNAIFETYILTWDADSWKEIAKKRIKNSGNNSATVYKSIEKLNNTDPKSDKKPKTLSEVQKYHALDSIMEAWELVIESATSYQEYKEALKAVLEGNVISLYQKFAGALKAELEEKVISLDKKINEVLINEARNLHSCLSETELNRLNSKNFSDVFITDIYDYLTQFILTEFNEEEKKQIKIPPLTSAAKCLPGQLAQGNIDNNLATVYRGLSPAEHDKLILLQQVLQGQINELDINQLNTLHVLISDMLTKNYSSKESLQIADHHLAVEQARTEQSTDNVYEQMVKSFNKTKRAIEIFIQFKEGKKIELNNQDPDYLDVLIKILNFSSSEQLLTVLKAFNIVSIKSLINNYSEFEAFLINFNMEKAHIILAKYYDSIAEIVLNGEQFYGIYHDMPEEKKEQFFEEIEPRFTELEITGEAIAAIFEILPEAQKIIFFDKLIETPLTKIEITGEEFGAIFEKLTGIQKITFFDKLKDTLADNTGNVADFYTIMVTIPKDKRDVYFESVKSKLVEIIKEDFDILSNDEMLKLKYNMSPEHFAVFYLAYREVKNSNSSSSLQNVEQESDSEDENSDSSSNSM